MRAPTEEPLLTRVIPAVDHFRPSEGAAYITGTSEEERSEHLSRWEASCGDVEFVRVAGITRSSIEVDGASGRSHVKLRDQKALQALVRQSDRLVYLDITGLPHHVWAPILRAIWDTGAHASVVYVEPGDYRPSAMPTPGTPFDLSERIEGIAPLPGFASLARPRSRSVLFVPLLGFEGARLAYLLEATQPDEASIVPIVGVPGFRLEYPFYTYLGNREQLLDTRSWREVHYATANCPFSLFNRLEEIVEKRRAGHVRLGLIGTKPHAVGAVLYRLAHPDSVELIHDHPVRKERRTKGMSRVCLYDVGLFRTRVA